MGAPPEYAFVSCGSSPCSSRSSAMNAVIAAIVNVAPWRSPSRSVSAASNRYASTSGAGVSMPTARCPISPVMWNSGAIARTTSSRVRPTQSR